jgi:N-acetylglutamate synthase-like GNAT family acetyltransferase
MNIVIKQIDPAEHASAQEFYTRVGYLQPIKPEDIVFCAFENHRIVGIVRLAPEHDFLVLRGMQIASSRQRNGLGTEMIKVLEKKVDKLCYCLPHAWLENFYGQIGFKKIPDSEAPPHLYQRLIEGRKIHPKLIVMKREV